MTTNLNFKSRQRGTTAAGLGGLALASVLLLCGAGNAPIENFTPQGAMQADLNAGGHSLTNAATVSATNVTAANLTVNGKTLGVNNALTLAGTDGSTLNVGAGGTLGSNAFTSTVYVPATTAVNGHALTNSVTLSASDLTTGTLPDGQLPTDAVKTGSAQTITGTKTFSSAPILGSNTFETSGGTYTLTVPATQNDTLATLGASQTFTGEPTFGDGYKWSNGQQAMTPVGYLYSYAGTKIADAGGYLYYGNGDILCNISGDIYYGNGSLLGDANGRLYADGGLIYTNGSGTMVVQGLTAGVVGISNALLLPYGTDISDLSNGSATVKTYGGAAWGALATGQFNSAATQTTVSGSTSGIAVFSQPLAGTSFKLVSIHLSSLVGTASYTFPSAFTNAPTESDGLGLATSISTTAVTVTGSTTSKDIILIGY